MKEITIKHRFTKTEVLSRIWFLDYFLFVCELKFKQLMDIIAEPLHMKKNDGYLEISIRWKSNDS